MWFSIPSAESLTRPRLAVAVVSAAAAVSIAYYAYQSRTTRPFDLPPGPGLHRSNAVRRRHNRRNDDGSSSSSEAPGDENADTDNNRPVGEAETIVETGDEWWNEPTTFPSQRAGHNIVNLLFRVSEDNARRNGCVHRGCQCNSCGMVPIRGIRYRCANCADFDLCETCEAQGVHIKTHIFYKIRVPAPPFGPRQMQAVWYTGDPDTCRRNLPRGLIMRLSRDTGFERPELEAFWEQWTFMANTEWRDDPDELGIAMDRKTFERCLVPTGGSRHAAPNLIHDRMFSFYDSNRDGLIGFTEFLKGLSYRKRKGKLAKVFDGYDIDEDGFVNRKDFLRMFRAYYVLYKQMHKDILNGLEIQLLASTEAEQLVNSRQPLSSLFGREGRVPPGDSRLRYEGKNYRRDGSVEIVDDVEGVVIEDRGDTSSRQDILTNLFACETEHRTRRQFVTPNGTDSNWRTVHRASGSRSERPYLLALLDPPSALAHLPGLFELGESSDSEETEEEVEEEEDEGDEDDEEEEKDEDEDGKEDGQDEAEAYLGSTPTESARRENFITQARQEAPKVERRKRDMARKQLHERWKRRQFYLDAEEGGEAPEDWQRDEDTLMNARETGESSKSAADSKADAFPGSASRVRFMEDTEDEEVESHASESGPELETFWDVQGSFPDAEQDAGKEILYQVTQQAFNELLDTIFKSAEDLAMEAAATKDRREKYKHLIKRVRLEDDESKPVRSSPPEHNNDGNPEWLEYTHPDDKSLEELLSETGFTLVPSDDENDNKDNDVIPAATYDDETLAQLVGHLRPRIEPFRESTLPHFRANMSDNTYSNDQVWYPIVERVSQKDPSGKSKKNKKKKPKAAKAEDEPSIETLRQWKRIEAAEAQAEERGGWAKLNFEEFEAIYKSQEHHGNRLDYLGSWIDFCIP